MELNYGNSFVISFQKKSFLKYKFCTESKKLLYQSFTKYVRLTKGLSNIKVYVTERLRKINLKVI